MFCAIATTIERCKTEGVVDVFQVVKALRVQKPGAVANVVSRMSFILCLQQILGDFDISDAVQDYFRCRFSIFGLAFELLRP